MTPQQRLQIAHTIDFLERDAGEEECWCNDPLCSVESPKCGAREKRFEIEQLKRLIRPEVTTRHPERLNSPSERIYFEHAQKLAERHSHINGGYSDLEHILNHDLRNPPKPVSVDEAEVIGTFVQWLGTACGRCFIHECEEQIAREHAERSEWHFGTLGPWHPRPTNWSIRHAERLVFDQFDSENQLARRTRDRVTYALDQLIAITAVRVGVMTAEDAATRLSITVPVFMKLFDRATEVAREWAKPAQETAGAA